MACIYGWVAVRWILIGGCLGGVVPGWTVDFRSACGLGVDLVCGMWVGV